MEEVNIPVQPHWMLSWSTQISCLVWLLYLQQRHIFHPLQQIVLRLKPKATQIKSSSSVHIKKVMNHLTSIRIRGHTMTEKNLAWKDSKFLPDTINQRGIRIKIRAQTTPEKNLETKDTDH